jgi:hypothetical protein
MEEKYLLSQSCETYVLENEVLISAFPGLIVFGKTEANKHYLKNCCFKLTCFQIKKLFTNIIAILAFFNDPSIHQKCEKIIDVEFEEIYYWQGLSVSKNNVLIKVVKFAIEKEQNTIFHIIFTLEEMNTFIHLLSRCVLGSLCLKDEDEEFIIKLTENSISDIEASKKSEIIASKLVKTYLKQQKIEHLRNQRPLIFILQYYNEVILAIKHLTNLHFEETS